MTPNTEASAPFLVTIEPSGRQFSVQTHQTILEAALAQGIGLPYGCKDGACGSCKCQKLAGEVVHGEHQSSALTPVEEAQGWVLTCCARTHSALRLQSRQVPAADALPIRRLPARVRRIDSPTGDVRVLTLQLPSSETFTHYPGQYLDIILRDGTRRSYSMASMPAQGAAAAEIELHIRQVTGGKFTDQILPGIKERDILRIEGPFGSFFLREDSAKPIVLVAAGTGFAPIKAVLQRLLALASARAVTLLWGVRRPHDLYHHDWMQAQLARAPGLRYVPVLSEALPEDRWRGRTGMVHQALAQDYPDLSAHQVYVCGAPVVVNLVRQVCRESGLPDEEFFADAFLTEADRTHSSAP